jgi:hypothetical protein
MYAYPDKINFEQWLMDEFSYSLVNTEDDPGDDVDRFDEMFWEWVEKLPTENMIEYCNKYSRELIESERKKSCVKS